MHVKAGDLAIQIISHAGNDGKIVKVLRFVGEYHYSDGCIDHDAWECDYGMPVCGAGGDIKQIRYISDAWLRPVSGLPMEDEVKDETKELA